MPVDGRSIPSSLECGEEPVNVPLVVLIGSKYPSRGVAQVPRATDSPRRQSSRYQMRHVSIDDRRWKVIEVDIGEGAFRPRPNVRRAEGWNNPSGS